MIGRSFNAYCRWVERVVDRIEQDQFLWAVSISLLCVVAAVWHARPALEAFKSGKTIFALVPAANAWKTGATPSLEPASLQLTIAGILLLPFLIAVAAVVRGKLRPHL